MYAQIQFACLLVAVCLVGSISAQVYSRGPCPEVTVQENFDVNRYLGIWYEAARFYTTFQKDSRCVVANYTLKDNGHINVLNSGYFPGEGYGSDVGDGKPNPDNPAKIGLKFNTLQPRGKYWVLDTDYDTYTLVHSCSSFFDLFNVQLNWILVRDSSLSTGDASKIQPQLTKFEKQGIYIDRFQFYGHVNCPPKDTGV
ncbi:apolipoprotein D-like [Antedon mediterranea]|uniref:apolipoprotein D-like n=1 Tax=Antedon mediterranea TaxID=105859 RepID=UPI003AF883BF